MTSWAGVGRTARTTTSQGDGFGYVQWWRGRVDALKSMDLMQAAAVVQKRGGPDAVRFLTATSDEQAVWMAALELDIEWEREAAESRADE